MGTKTYEELLAEMEELQIQLQEAQDAIEAIRTGQVDALVVRKGSSHQLYSLKSADQTYRVFIEKMKEGAVTLDKNGIILYCNTQFSSMIGLPLPVVIGMHFMDFVPPEFAEYFKQLSNKGWQSDSKGEIYLKKKNNERIPFLLSFASLQLDEGEALSIILTDLTAQKESEEQLRLKNELLEEAGRNADKMNEELEDIVLARTRDLYLSREHFRFLADNIPVIVWTTERNGDGVYFNKQWYEFTGLTFENSKGDRCKQVYHPDDIPSYDRVWEEAIKCKTGFHCEYRIKRAIDGNYRWHLGKAEPLTDESGNIIAWFGTSTDIEDQKKEMEKKDEFISTASHELKTPLSSAKGYVQLIGRQKTLSGTASQYVVKANESINKLQHLINNLLDVSKIAAGKLKFTTETFNLSNLINSCVEDCRHMYGGYNFHLQVQDNILVSGNAERLEQVLMNLISNAVKYSAASKKIDICGESTGGRAIVSVTDFGIGLTDENQQRIFERFFRVEEGRFSPGLGIGLYIAAEIIKEHHGKIQVHSKVKQGSTFSFSLPLARS